MKAKKKGSVPAARRLVDRLVPRVEDGSLLAILGTTYELQSEFLETDFLPSLLGLGAWDDRNWTSRIAIEKSLAMTEAASVFVDATCYRGRPRSLRLTIHPVCVGRTRILHAKVTLLVYARSVRLLVGSANLTESGYRKNREVAATLRVTAEDMRHAPLVRDAITGLRSHLARNWDDAAERAATLATSRLDEWTTTAPDDAGGSWFAWSGADDAAPLWRQVTERWPRGEHIRAITIISPFWSEEAGDGALAQFIEALRGRDALASGTRIRLLTDARPVADGKYAPVLPESFRAWKPTAAEVTVTAVAVDPSVLAEEVDGMDEIRATRRLHAKVVLVESDKHTLAYFGSANFTQHGWGFARGIPANVEAGIVVLANGAGRAQLAQLVPLTSGPEIPLDGAAGDRLALLSGVEPSAPWPAFIREVRLVPALDGAEDQRLALEVTTFSEEVGGAWSAALIGDAATPLASGDRKQAATTRVALAPQTLERLLIDQEVCIRWWDHPEGARFPVNVALTARDELPIAPGSQHPSEHLLLAYYQGRIAWEALYPDPSVSGATDRGAPLPLTTSQVDTSKIQAYQVREFVEALRGMRDDLKGASSSPGTMRLALLGPVSPVALSRHIRDAVKRSERTPTAGAFQLVEILGCLEEAARVPVEREQPSWNALLAQARAEVARLLIDLQDEHATFFPVDGSFRRFQTLIERFHRPEGT